MGWIFKRQVIFVPKKNLFLQIDEYGEANSYFATCEFRVERRKKAAYNSTFESTLVNKIPTEQFLININSKRL